MELILTPDKKLCRKCNNVREIKNMDLLKDLKYVIIVD